MWKTLTSIVALTSAVKAGAPFPHPAADPVTLDSSPFQEFKSLNSSPDVLRNGPYIYDEYGELVWDGTASPYNFGHSMTFMVFKYQGQDVMCLWQGEFSPAGYGKGHGLLLDNHYNVVGNISSTVPNAPMDFHEFSLTDQGTALISIYATEPYNMTSEFGDLAANSSEQIMGGYFQEIDVATGKTLFTWRSLDHQDPHECYATPEDTGTTKEIGWDYFHINSVEKDDQGNYLVSARHCHTVYYVNGTNGDVIWRLGGQNSSFAMGEGVEFAWQHYARFRENNTISLFDNGAGPHHVDHEAARGMIIQLDYDKMFASLVYEALPYNHTWSGSQGSMEKEVDGSWLVGWGSRNWISEYKPSGPALVNGSAVTNSTTPIPDAQSGTLEWAAKFGGGGDINSYRNLRANWTAYPETKPALVVVGGKCSPRHAYMSWNGATEVARWEILAGNETTGCDLVSLVNVTRTGFETNVSLPDADLSVIQARAISRNGSSLGCSDFAVVNVF